MGCYEQMTHRRVVFRFHLARSPFECLSGPRPRCTRPSPNGTHASDGCWPFESSRPSQLVSAVTIDAVPRASSYVPSSTVKTNLGVRKQAKPAC